MQALFYENRFVSDEMTGIFLKFESVKSTRKTKPLNGRRTRERRIAG
jgi:hypothetical protein